MAKLIKKSKCKFVAGQIVKKNELIGIPYPVWAQLNKLELIVQQYDYLLDQKPACAGPSLDGFKRKSALHSKLPYVSMPDTPVMDKRVEEAMAFIDEVDNINNANEINEAIDEYGELIDWLNCEEFVEGECTKAIDTPTLGNPLDLVADDVVAILSQIIKFPVAME